MEAPHTEGQVHWSDSVDGMSRWLHSENRLNVDENTKKGAKTGIQAMERAVLLGCYEEAAGSTPVFADGSRACTSSLTTARVFGQSVQDDSNTQLAVLLTGYALLSTTPSTQWSALANIVHAAPSIASQLGAKAASEIPHAFAAHWHQLAMREMIQASMAERRERNEAPSSYERFGPVPVNAIASTDSTLSFGDAPRKPARFPDAGADKRKHMMQEANAKAHLPGTDRYKHMMRAVRSSGKDIIESLQVLIHLVCLWSVSGMLTDPQRVDESDVSVEDEKKAIDFFVKCLRDGTARAPMLNPGQAPEDVEMIPPRESINHDAARGRTLKYKVYDATLGTAVALTGILTTSLVVTGEDQFPKFTFDDPVGTSDSSTTTTSSTFPFSFAFAAEIALLELETPDSLNRSLAVYANAVRVAIKEHDFLARMSYSDPLEVMTVGWVMGMVALRRLQYAALRKLEIPSKIQIALGLDQPPSPEVTLVVACVWLGAQSDMATRDRMKNKDQEVVVDGKNVPIEHVPSAFAKMLEPQFHNMLKPTTMVAGVQDNVLWMMWRSAFCAAESVGFEAWTLVRKLANPRPVLHTFSKERRMHVLNRRRVLPMAAAAMAVLFAGPCAAGVLQQNGGEALALVSCYASVPKLIYPIMHLFWVNTSAWEWMLRFGDLDPQILLAPLFVEHVSTAFDAGAGQSGAGQSGAGQSVSEITADALRSMGWPIYMGSDGRSIKNEDGRVKVIQQNVSDVSAEQVESRVYRFFHVVQLVLEKMVTRPMLRFAAMAGGDFDQLMKLPVTAMLPTKNLLLLAEGVHADIGSKAHIAYNAQESSTSARYDIAVVPLEIWLAMLTDASLVPSHSTSPRAAEVICELCAQVQMLDSLVTTRQPLVNGPDAYDNVFDVEIAKRVDANQELKARESVRLLMAAQSTNALTSSIAQLVRAVDTSHLTDAQHNFLVIAYLTGSRSNPLQIYARCVTIDTAKCVHAMSEERNMTDWRDFAAAPDYDYWVADYNQSPHTPETVAAAHMSRGFKNAISRTFERRLKTRITHLASPTDAHTLRQIVSSMDDQDTEALVNKSEKEDKVRLDMLREEQKMTPQVTVDAEAIKALHTMAVGVHWHTLPKLDDITHRIVKYITGRKTEAEITEQCADIVTLQCEVTGCCFVPKMVVLPFETTDFRLLYPDTPEE